MKSVLILIMVLLSTSSVFAQAVTSTESSKYNFRFSPLALILGIASATLDVVIYPDWTVGPELFYAKFKVNVSGGTGTTYDVNLASAGVRANWFKNGVYTDGLYVGPFVRYAKTSIDASGTTTITGEAAGVAIGSLVGYGWFWNSFNMMLGGGAAVAIGDSNIVVTESNGKRTEIPNRGAGFAGEFTVGWAF